MNFNSIEFLNYLVTNYTSCNIYTEVGGHSAATCSARYICASVARTGSGATNMISVIEFTRYSAAAFFNLHLQCETVELVKTNSNMLQQAYVSFSISEVVGAIGCLVPECHVCFSVFPLLPRELT